MNKKSNKRKTLIVTLLCAFITLGITVGICCYNYFGYVNYKILYLTEYFDVNGEVGVTVEDKVERSMMWDSSFYTDELNVTYRDPYTKEEITSTHVTNDESLHVDAYVEEYTLHLPKYFDMHLYQMVKESVNDEGKTEYTLTYYFYFYNINYNTIKDFDPQYIRMTFVNGIGEESDEELQEALDDFDLNGETGNQPEVYSYTIMSENETDMLATFSLYDNAVNTFDEEGKKFYYVYRNRCNASFDDQTKFNEAKNLTFSVYYLNDDAKTESKLINLVEGTFTAKLNENGKVPTAEEVFKQVGLTKGYNRNYYQDSYKEFVKPRLIKTAIITFVVAGLITTLFAVVWLINPEEVSKATPKKKVNKK